MQSNQIMYSSERLLKFEGRKDLDSITVRPTQLGDVKNKKSSTNNDNEMTSSPKRLQSANRIKTVDERLPAYYVRSRSAAKIRERERGIGGYVSQYAHLQKKDDTNPINPITKTATGKSILRIIFLEKYDYIIAACEDKNIYVWGFDLEALKALTALRDQPNDINTIAEGISIQNYFDFSFIYFYTDGAEVANRVVGFTLRRILSGHTNLVTALAIVDDVESFGRVFLLSSGWDGRIVLWDLTNFSYFSNYVNRKATDIEEAQMAAKGNIHDMDYSPYLKYFAYTSSDMCVYVRKFSTVGEQMELMYTLEANLDSEVYCVKWNFITNQWVTGMENGEIRIWVLIILFIG